MASTSLGTAWIQIKPSLSGISNDIKKELSGATVYGTSAMKSQFLSTFKGLGKNIQSEFTNAFSKVTSTTKGLFATGIGATIGTLTSQISGAISRLDILNNFPKVMANLNVSAEESSAAIAKISEKLQGLPTTLDAGAAAVQRFTSKNGNVSRSADMFLALNNALLAGGAATEIQETALEQLSQAYAKGKPDMMEWRSLMTAMPAQLNQIAQEMGFGANGADKLGESLRNGSVSMDKFMDAIIKLNENGTNGFLSFEEQAKNSTGGIATSIKVAKAAITRTMGEIISSIPNLGSSIVSAGQSVEKLFKGTMGLDEAANNVKTALQGILSAVGNTLKKIVPLVVTILPDIVTSIVDGIVDFLGNQEQVQAIINGFVRLFTAVAVGASRIAQAIIPLIPGIIEAFVTELTKDENRQHIIIGFGILFGVATFKTVAGNLGKVLTNTVGSKFSSFFKTDIAKNGAKEGSSAIQTLGTNLSSAIKGIATPIKTAFTELGQILGTVVTAIMEPIKAAFKGIGEALAGFFTALADPAIAIGAAMFVVIAAAIAAAILMIGGAIGVVTPAIKSLFDDVLKPLADFIVDKVLEIIDRLTDNIIILTNAAIIPLGSFLRDTFVIVLASVTNSITTLTNNALIPLIRTLSGAFSDIMYTISDVLTNVIATALGGVRDIVYAVGDAFEAMGRAIRNVIDGVTGIINAFGAIIQGVADAVVAIIAIANNRSIEYGRGFAHVYQMATGGLVGGTGTSFSDSNLFALSKGEYVVRASAARQIGYDNLDAMNETGRFTSGEINNNITINGYNKDPNELADIISRKIALRTRGVY